MVSDRACRPVSRQDGQETETGNRRRATGDVIRAIENVPAADRLLSPVSCRFVSVADGDRPIIPSKETSGDDDQPTPSELPGGECPTLRTHIASLLSAEVV